MTPDRETLAAAVEAAIPAEDVPGFRWRHALAAADALLAGPLASATCPYVVTGDEGAQHCTLAEGKGNP